MTWTSKRERLRTSVGFRGTAQPGDVLTINSAWEYSITREWVFALDFMYQHDASTSATITPVVAINMVY